MLNYIIWNVSPEIVTLGYLKIRWYGLLFASGFLLGQWIIGKIFKLEGKPEKDLEKLMISMVVSTVLGARLGHCLFYQPDYFLSHPIEILKIWNGGLASHGAGIGILIALYLYSRNREGQSFFWVVDRIVIVVALGGALIRMGNLMNSEIIGKPSNQPFAFVFAHGLDDVLHEASPAFIKADKKLIAGKDTVVDKATYTPIEATLRFDKRKTSLEEAKKWVETNFDRCLTWGEVDKHYKRFSGKLIVKEAQNPDQVILTTHLYAIPRHPAQLYESLSTFLVFVFLLWMYSRRKGETPEGQLFGLFMVIVFTLRFFYEFFKENQVDFENAWSYNMGQLLSIPAVLIGLTALYLSGKNAKKKTK